MVDLPLFVTPYNAIKLNYKLLEPVPAIIECQFCGTGLDPIGRRSLTRAEIVEWKGFQKCNCKAASDERDRLSLEETRRQQEEVAEAARMEIKARTEKLFKQSKLGARFTTRAFENFKVNPQNKVAYETALKYATEFERFKAEGMGIIFNGPYGTGKTHLAASIAHELIKREIPVVFGTTISLLGMIKQSYDSTKFSEDEVTTLYNEVELLIIDDLGKERVNEWVLEKLYLIVNSRYENNLPIVITTNYDIDGLTARLSTDKNRETAEAVTSRLWEMCRGFRVEGEDWRKK